MLKILHITEDHSLRYTGITQVIDRLSKNTAGHIKGRGHVHIFTAGTDHIAASEGVSLTSLPINNFGKIWRWSRNIESAVEAIIKSEKPSVIHLHGVWMAPPWYGAKLAGKHGIPFILTLHGMLEPWRWNHQGKLGKLKKQIYWRTIAFPAFKQATVIQAITPLERDNLSSLFPGQRIEIISNSIDLSLVDSQSERPGINDVEPFILFLGRIHSMKGVDLLVRAFGDLQLSDKWRLVIAGPAEVPEYLEKLRSLVYQFHLEERIDFIGPVYGAERWKWYRRAWAVAFPSYSEVVGMVNLEAAACNTPTITTHATGLWDWEEGGGFLVHPDAAELAEALQTACSWSNQERIERGQSSRRLIEQRYSLNVIGKRWLELYEDLGACRT